jgi:hypothetical protein
VNQADVNSAHREKFPINTKKPPFSGGTLPAKSASGPPLGEKCWHLDEVVIFIGAQDHWLWWVADQDGFILDVLVQSPRNKRPPNG